MVSLLKSCALPCTSLMKQLVLEKSAMNAVLRVQNSKIVVYAA